MLVLKGLVGLHRPFNFSFFSITDWGIGLDYRDIEWLPWKQTEIILSFLRLGKTRDLFKKIRYTKGTFHAKMGSIKDRNGIDLTEAEDIKKMWQEYTELYKKDLHNPDNHKGVVTHLEPDILECEVKCGP